MSIDTQHIIEQFSEAIENSENSPAKFVAFFDLVNSTGYKVGKDVMSPLVKVHNHNKVVVETVSQQGGDVVKLTGDGCLVVFEGSKNGAQSLVESIKEIFNLFIKYNSRVDKDSRIATKVGIAYGRIVTFRYGELREVQGLIVDIACRLSGIARANQILCTKESVSELQNRIEGGKFRAVKNVRISGLSQPVGVSTLELVEVNRVDIDTNHVEFIRDGFFTLPYYLEQLSNSSERLWVFGITNRHFSGSPDIYNQVLEKVKQNDRYELRLYYLNPNSPFFGYASQIKRSYSHNLKDEIFRNAYSAAKLFQTLTGNVALYFSDYPIIIPYTVVDEELLFGLPFRSSTKVGRLNGVQTGYYFRTSGFTDVGQRILENTEEGPVVRISIERVLSENNYLSSIIENEC